MPEISPIIIAPKASTLAQPAVIATRPAREPLRVIETSGLPFLTHVKIIVEQVATPAARVVVPKI